MAKIKFRTNIGEVYEEKSFDAYIHSGAIHHFFYSWSIFVNYSVMNDEPVRGTTGIAKVVEKSMVWLLINNSIFIQAYYAPKFDPNILAVRLLSKDFEVLFSTSIRA